MSEGLTNGESGFKFAKFLTSMRRSPEKQVEAPGSLDLLAEGRELVYFESDSKKFAANQQRASEIMDILPIDLKTDPQQLYDLYAIPQFDANFNAELTSKFRKEDTAEMPIDRFRIVTDQDGQNWLMKSFRDVRWLAEQFRHPLLNRVNDLRALQSEEGAYEAARLIGYPVPETKFVQYDGKPWLAYRYISDAADHSSFSVDTTRAGEPIVINSRKDVINRPLFNALVGAAGDSADQGIVDKKTGQYYAQDVAEFVDRDADVQTVEEMAARIANKWRSDYGPICRGIEGEQQAYAEFINSLQYITPETAPNVFEHYIGTEQEKRAMASSLNLRARALQLLWSQGFFRLD